MNQIFDVLGMLIAIPIVISVWAGFLFLIYAIIKTIKEEL